MWYQVIRCLCQCIALDLWSAATIVIDGTPYDVWFCYGGWRNLIYSSFDIAHIIPCCYTCFSFLSVVYKKHAFKHEKYIGQHYCITGYTFTHAKKLVATHVARTYNSECQAKGNAKCQEVYTKTKIPITE